MNWHSDQSRLPFPYSQNYGLVMADKGKEEDLLCAIDEVEARILKFRQKLLAVLANFQPEDRPVSSVENLGE